MQLQQQARQCQQQRARITSTFLVTTPCCLLFRPCFALCCWPTSAHKPNILNTRPPHRIMLPSFQALKRTLSCHPPNAAASVPSQTSPPIRISTARKSPASRARWRQAVSTPAARRRAKASRTARERRLRSAFALACVVRVFDFVLGVRGEDAEGR